MSRSKRSHEGVVVLDNRDSPGISSELTHNTNLPPGTGQGFAELPTFTCSHCQHVVVMNSARTRSRGYCRKCDHYICDACEAEKVLSGGVCVTYKQKLDVLQENNFLTEQKLGVKING